MTHGHFVDERCQRFLIPVGRSCSLRQCEVGYTQSGKNQTCLANGKWDHDDEVPACSRKNASILQKSVSAPVACVCMLALLCVSLCMYVVANIHRFCVYSIRRFRRVSRPIRMTSYYGVLQTTRATNLSVINRLLLQPIFESIQLTNDYALLSHITN